VITGWHDRREDCVVRTCRQEAIRSAKCIVALNGELVDNRKALNAEIEDVAPELCELPGVGSVVAPCVVTAWSHRDRVRSEAAFAALVSTG
jgi:endonuclease III